MWDHDYKPELYDLFLRLGFTKFIDQWGLKPNEESAQPEQFTGEVTSVLIKIRPMLQRHPKR